MQPSGTVFTSSWLVDQGYSLDLQKQYRNSNWFESIGLGAMKRMNDDVPLEGALFALQQQLNLHIHIGGKSALGLHGKVQYLQFGSSTATLFGPLDETLPKWFRDYDKWRDGYQLTRSDFLPQGIGMTDHSFGNYSLKVSSPARAMMECLYLVPKKQPLVECYEIMEGLNNLRPASVQQLLEKCGSIKVKRLFLLLAEKAGHSWFDYIKLERINLGTGKRSLVPKGTYNAKYQLTLPKELDDR